MSYYSSTTSAAPFDDVYANVVEGLKKEGFGVLTEIDVKDTLRKKLDVDFQRYKILGACNPPFAYKALQTENKIGVMLPCNIIIQEMPDGKVEVAAIDPLQSMQTVDNPALKEIAREIGAKLRNMLKTI